MAVGIFRALDCSIETIRVRVKSKCNIFDTDCRPSNERDAWQQSLQELNTFFIDWWKQQVVNNRSHCLLLSTGGRASIHPGRTGSKSTHCLGLADA